MTVKDFSTDDIVNQLSAQFVWVLEDSENSQSPYSPNMFLRGILYGKCEAYMRMTTLVIEFEAVGNPVMRIKDGRKVLFDSRDPDQMREALKAYERWYLKLPEMPEPTYDWGSFDFPDEEYEEDDDVGTME